MIEARVGAKTTQLGATAPSFTSWRELQGNQMFPEVRQWIDGK
jgi:hypothetical protein